MYGELGLRKSHRTVGVCSSDITPPSVVQTALCVVVALAYVHLKENSTLAYLTMVSGFAILVFVVNTLFFKQHIKHTIQVVIFNA